MDMVASALPRRLGWDGDVRRCMRVKPIHWAPSVRGASASIGRSICSSSCSCTDVAACRCTDLTLALTR